MLGNVERDRNGILTTSNGSPGQINANQRVATLLIITSAILFSSLACNLGTYLAGSDENTAIDQTAGMELSEALAVPLADRRPTVLEQMGGPDVFSIQFEELEGQVVRSEQWSYLDYETRFDFIDGELLWTVELEPVPDGSIYAHYYDPQAFSAYMSSEQVKGLLPDQELLELDLAEADIPGGTILAGDQIIFGFDQDRLVYVETFMLSPEVSQ